MPLFSRSTLIRTAALFSSVIPFDVISQTPPEPLSPGARPTAAVRRVVRRPAVWVPLTVLPLAGLLVLLLGPIAWWATPAKHLQGRDKADVRNATRQTLLAAVGGLVVLTGAAFTARTFYLTRRGQFTDRYTKAIGQLASDKLTERLGGIYALEHLMAESDRDHNTVVEVLAAFVRERGQPEPAAPTPIGPVGAEYIPSAHAGSPVAPPTDVQAALTVLGRRPDRPEPNPVNLRYTDLRRADLEEAQLPTANLEGAQLQRANLGGANLKGANLMGANLQGANLWEAQLKFAALLKANLQGAILQGAQLPDAFLIGANLQDAILIGANLKGAILVGTNLKGAFLVGTNLQDANLTEANLQDANLTRAQMPDADLRPPPADD